MSMCISTPKCARSLGIFWSDRRRHTRASATRSTCSGSASKGMNIRSPPDLDQGRLGHLSPGPGDARVACDVPGGLAACGALALRVSSYGQAGEPAPVYPHLFRHARVRQIVRTTKSLPIAQKQAGWSRLQMAYLSVAQGHRRIVPLTGGTFTGPQLNGKLLPGASADWH